MCGLAGLFLARGAAPLEADLAAMVRSMAHRGPDGSRQWRNGDGTFQAGFVRLSIIDLPGGDQPIADRDGRRVLMGNGEIYNYVELRREADVRDYPYATQGDMEVVLPLEAARGDAFVHALNGMYALALYDGNRHRLLLVRDRLGIKPLYWTRVPGGVLFASEIKALFASGLVRPEIDPAAAGAYLDHGFVPAPRTLFRGIDKVPPGHTLSVSAAGEVALERYWRAAPDPDLPADPAGIEERLDGLLADSLRLQLRSDVPLGALLSGGLDSGLVVAMAARQAARPPRTFTVRFEGAAVDESPLAEAVARRYATDHTTLDVSPGQVADLLPNLVWFLEEPVNDPALLPNYLIEAALGAQVKVALNGTGGDELFAGYGRHFRHPAERRYRHLPAWLRHGLVEPALGLAAPMTAWRLGRTDGFDGDRGAYLFDHCTQFPPPMRRLVGTGLPAAEPAQSRFFREYAGPPQSAALYADLNTYLPEDLLTLLDRTSMAVSVEGRVPFLDHRLVEAALAVPPHVRTPGGRQKGLERALARRYLPDEVLTAPKRGFAAPVPAWMTAGLGDLARRILTRPAALDRGWWTAAGVDALLRRPDRHAFRLYSLLVLELVQHLFVDRAGRAEAPGLTLRDLADAA
ncbi:MAG: asparagine synthase (glutamine-hydrolyzing) [Hyphomicrobiales bacterium]|nr:asparagine synthase (glutamine-hydrolyzing) [Hyphomicrobiales bacterium]MCP5370522.1 asparagine synthase (glutamine-hydrolyzing) [Hyphomicrobiales bacterium]